MPAKTQTTKKKKKKGHAPAHQNAFAFAHNPKSKLTAKILASPNVGVCRRCKDRIEWRKKYRKYKPRTKPGRCNLCEKRGVVSAAYHTICTACAGGAVALGKIGRGGNDDDRGGVTDDGEEASVGTLGSDTNDGCADEGEILPRSDCPPVRACAVCVREPALPDSEGDDALVEKKLRVEIQRSERRLGRTLKLRERKGIERRVTRSVLGEGKGKRQEEGEGDGDGDGDVGEEEDSGDGGNGQGREEDEERYLSSADEGDGEEGKEDVEGKEDSDEADDPFLAAVGGKDKLLTGDAYRKMLLERGT